VSEERPAALAIAFPSRFADDEVSFLQGLRRCIDERRADGRHLAVLLIECGVIDRIDGVWGYRAGDAARARIAAGLRAEVMREDDLVGDVGRDDVACALSPVDDRAVAMLAAEKSLRWLNMPLWFGDDQIYARPAVGIAIWPEHGEDAESLLQHAKGACSAAQHLPSRIAVHSDLENPETARLLYENRLRTAVVEDALDLVFQPQYDLRLGNIVGVETLLRWRDAALGAVPTADAFAAAEAGGSVTEWTSSLLNRALRNCSEFRYSAGLDLRLAVNFPGRTLLQAALPDVIQRALSTWRLRPGRLMMEISDTAVLRSESLARETLGRLKDIGVKLSIDDTGATVSSLFWLSAMPFREFKLDLSSVRDPAEFPRCERIAQSLIELAHHLKLDVVAVGVPDEEMAGRLKELGCDFMQAHYKGPALDAAGFVARYGGG
jgi:diguanylate cyclase (GGDEF)-like protein